MKKRTEKAWLMSAWLVEVVPVYFVVMFQSVHLKQLFWLISNKWNHFIIFSFFKFKFHAYGLPGKKCTKKITMSMVMAENDQTIKIMHPFCTFMTFYFGQMPALNWYCLMMNLNLFSLRWFILKITCQIDIFNNQLF